MKKMIPIVFMATLLSLGAQAVSAQEMSVEDIVKRANLVAYYAGKDGVADVKMTITDSQGRTRERQLRILRYDEEDGGEQKYYVYFFKPADVSKMVFMVWKHFGQDDDRWLYLPALDLVRRIAATDKRSSFVGSHFVYEDVSGRSLEVDTHELVETTDTAYKIKNTPKETAGVEFAYYFVWIDKVNFMPMKAEYYNDKNELVRQIEVKEVKDVQGNPTVVRSVAQDVQRNGTTEMVFENVQYDVGLETDIFAERYLRQAPAKWTRP